MSAPGPVPHAPGALGQSARGSLPLRPRGALRRLQRPRSLLLLPNTPFASPEPSLSCAGPLVGCCVCRGNRKEAGKGAGKGFQTEETARAKAGRVDRRLRQGPPPSEKVSHKLMRSEAAVPRAPEDTEGLAWGEGGRNGTDLPLNTHQER